MDASGAVCAIVFKELPHANRIRKVVSCFLMAVIILGVFEDIEIKKKKGNSIKFANYSNRKDIIIKTQSDIISYIEPENLKTYFITFNYKYLSI